MIHLLVRSAATAAASSATTVEMLAKSFFDAKKFAHSNVRTLGKFDRYNIIIMFVLLNILTFSCSSILKVLVLGCFIELRFAFLEFRTP